MVNADCQVLIEETAHIFAEIIRNNGDKETTIQIPKKVVSVTLNSEKGKEVYDGVFSLDGKKGLLQTKSDGFLKSNTIHYLGSGQHYTLATRHGLVYMQLEVGNSFTGKLFLYSNRLSHNPKNEIPMVTFKNQ